MSYYIPKGIESVSRDDITLEVLLDIVQYVHDGMDETLDDLRFALEAHYLDPSMTDLLSSREKLREHLVNVIDRLLPSSWPPSTSEMAPGTVGSPSSHSIRALDHRHPHTSLIPATRPTALIIAPLPTDSAAEPTITDPLPRSGQLIEHAHVGLEGLDLEQHMVSIASQLNFRGKGRHYCPLGRNCLKGGVQNQGVLRCFKRNSSFRAHLEKHLRSYKCELPGCPNKGGFARLDILQRHQARVNHPAID